ncbi:small multi-drug export protein [Desulfobacter latus]|uniref:Small multi-drug export protein n=1 Tax=Desulfobacter latus TaxID=2292 RepID=A0A850T1F3_9BACT|nr:small multi-drug export protein [Desulfobacter latus]NWH04921.1 small multi-drug export protein [Desulfobacter latus]
MKKFLLNSIAGRVLLTGILLTALFFIFFIVGIIQGVPGAKIAFIVFITHCVGSRAGGIGLCILNDFDPLTTIALNFYFECLIVCYTYAGFVLSTSGVFKAAWIKTFMGNLKEKAEEKKEKIKRWGWVGIFVFVMAPLPVTGPVVGTIIGYMLRMPLLNNFTAAGLGTLTAIVAWCYGFDLLEHRFEMLQYIFVAICIVIIIPYLKPLKKLINSLCRESNE